MKLAVAALFGLVASVLAAPVIEVGSFLFREGEAIGTMSDSPFRSTGTTGR